MKTEFLKGLGLEQDVIDKVMAENGKDIAAERQRPPKPKENVITSKTSLQQQQSL